MTVRLKGTVINMKSLSQHIDNPIVIGGGDSDGRYLTIIFTQEAAARFAPHTQVYLSWRHIQKEIKGYNVFTKFEYEDTSEITAEEQLQLNKICELEDKFVKGFSKDKWREYFDLDVEKGQLVNLQIDHVVEITYNICKKLFQPQ